MAKELKVLLAAGLLLFSSAALVRAEGGSGPSLGFGASGNSVVGAHVIGLGGSLDLPIGEGETCFNVDARWEFSKYKHESTGSSTIEQNLSGYRLRAGVDRRITVGESSHFYFGSGVSYASHKVTLKQTGSPDLDGEPYSVVGVNSRIGVATSVGSGNMEAFGQVENTFGWGSIDQSGTKTTQTDVTTGYQGGIRWRFGG
jgi:hypothetical protein